MHKLLIICGPTATGKTALAAFLAKRFHGELISADSRQIYKGLDVITGKDVSGVWMYDIVDVGKNFSVSQYQKRVLPIILDIEKRGRLPIIVGGTGLYIDAVVQPFETIHVPPSRDIRNKLERLSLTQLQKKLRKLDPMKWQRMNQSDRHNPRRLIRATEVALWKRQHGNPKEQKGSEFDALWIGLTMPIGKLAQKIQRRVAYRWEHGAIEEAQRYPSASALGITEIRSFLDGILSEGDAKMRWAMAEGAYAKRQMTWFKKRKQIHWFDVTKNPYKSAVTAMVAAWYTDHTHDQD